MSVLEVSSGSALRVGIGGPVGSGKTALVERLIPLLAPRGCDLAVITNDLVTNEDAERAAPQRADRPGAGARRGDRRLPAHRHPRGPDAEHRSGRAAGARLGPLDLILIESGGDNLASTFSLDLVDYWMFVIDVAGGDDIPRKRGPGITPGRPAGGQQGRSGAHVGVDLERMRADVAAVASRAAARCSPTCEPDGAREVFDELCRSALFRDLTPR